MHWNGGAPRLAAVQLSQCASAGTAALLSAAFPSPHACTQGQMCRHRQGHTTVYAQAPVAVNCSGPPPASSNSAGRGLEMQFGLRSLQRPPPLLLRHARCRWQLLRGYLWKQTARPCVGAHGKPLSYVQKTGLGQTKNLEATQCPMQKNAPKDRSKDANNAEAK